MRVAVLADIHGNLPALEAVLAEPDVAAADRVVLLGDIALGPMPAESLDLLASLGERAVWVHGNCEREVVTAYDGKSVPGPSAEGARATAALLDEQHRDLLDGLPLTVTLDVAGVGPALFCHATPRRDDEFVLVDSPLAVWRRALDGVSQPLVVMGHTHMPFDRLRRRAPGRQPRQRRNVVRRPGSVLGAARRRLSSCAGRGTTSRWRPHEDPFQRPSRRRCLGRTTTSSLRPVTPRRSRCSALVDPLPEPGRARTLCASAPRSFATFAGPTRRANGASRAQRRKRSSSGAPAQLRRLPGCRVAISPCVSRTRLQAASCGRVRPRPRGAGSPHRVPGRGAGRGGAGGEQPRPAGVRPHRAAVPDHRPARFHRPRPGHAPGAAQRRLPRALRDRRRRRLRAAWGSHRRGGASTWRDPLQPGHPDAAAPADAVGGGGLAAARPGRARRALDPRPRRRR